MNDVQKTLIGQVRHEVFIKNGKMLLVDDTTVRFNLGRTNIDVSYEPGLDLYSISTHKLSKDYVSTTTTVTGVYADQLKEFFPKRLHKDDNVKGLFALLEGRS